MNLCGEHGKQDIAYEERGGCPACAEIEDLKGQITDLKDRISTLEEEE